MHFLISLWKWSISGRIIGGRGQRVTWLTPTFCITHSTRSSSLSLSLFIIHALFYSASALKRKKKIIFRLDWCNKIRLIWHFSPLSCACYGGLVALGAALPVRSFVRLQIGPRKELLTIKPRFLKLAPKKKMIIYDVII